MPFLYTENHVEGYMVEMVVDIGAASDDHY